MAPPKLDRIFATSGNRLHLLARSGSHAVDGAYLHWDELRHREPPSGLTSEEWWAAIKLARSSSREAMPLADIAGRSFGLVYAAPIRQGLHKIDQRFGVAGPQEHAPGDVRDVVNVHGREYLLSNSLMEEAIRSSQLEGAATTRERAKDMIREQRSPRTHGERMILNNFFAMERIESLAAHRLSAETIFELHRILVDGTLKDPAKAGVYRTDEDHTVVELLHSIETAHVPPAATELPERMQRLLRFANAETPEDWLHPVLRAIILHFMIGYDHPFVDGNGRVARALFYWAMLRYGYPLTKFLSISRVLREAPARYSRAYLYTETDDGDLTYFIDHQIRVILRSIEALTVYVDQKLEATRMIEARVVSSPDLNHRQVRLLGHALRHPGFEYTVQSHRVSHRVAVNTARADLNDLADRELLLKSRRGRKHVFLAPRDLGDRVEAAAK